MALQLKTHPRANLREKHTAIYLWLWHIPGIAKSVRTGKSVSKKDFPTVFQMGQRGNFQGLKGHERYLMLSSF